MEETNHGAPQEPEKKDVSTTPGAEQSATPVNPAPKPVAPDPSAPAVAAPDTSSLKVEQPDPAAAMFGSSINPAIKAVQELRDKILNECHKVILGYDREMELMLAAILAEGHVLLEGVPGIAKTLVVKAMSRSIGADFSRIQFTPDLMPADVVGTNVFNPKTNEFDFKSGPIFSNVVLVDEINRSPAKTQAALFEVMEEKQITVDGTTYPLSFPFVILATQNPIEQEGTYRLPEAQLDRFLFRIKLQYPDTKQEVSILKRFRRETSQKELEKIQPVAPVRELEKAVEIVHGLEASDDILEYIAKIVTQTRESVNLFLGASPRASIAILRTAKVMAAFSGRPYLVPDDVKSVAKSVLNHRVIVSAENEMRGVSAEEIIDEIIAQIEVPR